MTGADRILATLARKGGSRLLDVAVRRALPDKPEAQPRDRNLLRGAVGAVALRVATSSVPGAIVVVSGALAKKLYDRRRERKRAGPKKASPDT